VDEFKAQREVFEPWVKRQFPGISSRQLEYDAEDGYRNNNISFMFIGFCAGWGLRE
jgi:hypothetical protein